ncbi:MAG TPA: ABC transporter ATP-binding protein [Armatimonadetes bacterium]|nr:ABC transporter ATP-binding protein [Armatimonadota bacterium]
MARVVLRNLTKRFGKVVAVKNINLEVKDGELLVLVGPSGCGKTTCLRLIAGLEEADEGEIWIGDKLVNDLPPKERDVAMVFQNYALYPHMSVYENMAFPLRMRKVPKGEIRRRVLEVAKMLGVEDLLPRKPGELSGGQRQRVALGRAIVRNPKVFLMDEPLSNLDAKLRVQMRSELVKLHRRLGATTIYVTHDQTEAMTMGDRIAVMKDGEVLQVDTPLNVYNRPASLFVAEFIGNPSMNLVEAVVRVEGGRPVLDAGPFVISPPKGGEEALLQFEGRKVIFGVRPEDLYVKGHSPLPADHLNTIRGKVDVVEPLGPTLLTYVDAKGIRVVASLDPSTGVREGEEVELVVDIRRTHAFDPLTERAIY